MNFAKLFLPFKKAHELHDHKLLEAQLKSIREDWQDDNSDSPEEDADSAEDEYEYEYELEQKKVEGEPVFMNKRSLTEDFVMEINREERDEENFTLFDKVLKYGFYPIYAFSRTEGRVRYLFDYLSVFLLFGCLWVISCSFSYFTHATTHSSL